MSKFIKTCYKELMQKTGFILLLFLISSCASPVISKKMRERASDLPFEVINKSPDLYKGILLIWGGRILSAKQTEDACMAEVLKMPLDNYLIAMENEDSRESFFVFIPGHLDPLLCKKGRLITIAGKLDVIRSDSEGNEVVHPFLKTEEINFHKKPLKGKPPVEREATKEEMLGELLKYILLGMSMSVPF